MRDDAFDFPDRPAQLSGASVAAWVAPVRIPSYLPEEPSRYPAYLDHRVYQGSSGRVYPLPFHDRISETPIEREWLGLHLENAWLRVLVLPELGGRIHHALDKRTGYQMFYANPVIKPALVGLAGPWLAGGVEFNWPQHHRPATFLPTAWTIEEQPGQVTVWCSDHDPFARMKGMHGIRLTERSTVLELVVRLFNRSDLPETFLWWANVAAQVHPDYQSFFPSDVHTVADHAKRAVSTFPVATTPYYGIDYPARHQLDRRPDSTRKVAGDRLDWYRNIPVPTSYMCLDSTGDFFGGYDHRAAAGFVHWADHHVAVGKKQWSWGDSPFGHAWNRNLADDGSAYIELMAGVFTDNQPDFSHLAPGETKTFSQYWYPVAETGPVLAATLDAAVGLVVEGGDTVLHWDVTRVITAASIIVRSGDGEVIREVRADLDPEHRFSLRVSETGPLQVELRSGDAVLLHWSTASSEADAVPPAVAPLSPAEVETVEELYLIGRHLEQYRHATRSPFDYWTEALRRDPGHAATHTALAARCYRQARFDEAATHLGSALVRLTRLNPNPSEGEAHYLLGLTMARLGHSDEAYAAFAKAAWLRAWVGPAQLQLAVIDARAGRDATALKGVEASLRAEPDQLQAKDLQVVLLRRLGRTDEAEAMLWSTLALDPLDAWAVLLVELSDSAHAESAPVRAGLDEAQTLIDLGCELARIGELVQAAEQFDRARRADDVRPLGQTGCAVLADYHAARVLAELGRQEASEMARLRARQADRRLNFPGRLDDIQALEWALAIDPTDPCAAALLGHWLYGNGRVDAAITRWQQSLALDPGDPVVWRNLGVALYNHRQDATGAIEAYDRALALAPEDARLWYESDQLLRRALRPPAQRLDRLAHGSAPIAERDDLSVEYAHLLISAERPAEALELLQGRRFQPWEGGEGLVLRVWERTQLSLAERALREADPGTARAHAEAALECPEWLGEARHPLANPSHLFEALGRTVADDDAELSRSAWRQAADSVGDFADLAPHRYSENTYYSVLAARALGEPDLACTLTDGLADHLRQLSETPASIDYFATSLPNLLLFEEDPQRRQDLSARLMTAQLSLLDDDRASAREQLQQLLAADPSHEQALDLLAALDLDRPLNHSSDRRAGRAGNFDLERIR